MIIIGFLFIETNQESNVALLSLIQCRKLSNFKSFATKYFHQAFIFALYWNWDFHVFIWEVLTKSFE